jgi:hypothetical protein
MKSTVKFKVLTFAILLAIISCKNKIFHLTKTQTVIPSNYMMDQ